MAEDLGERTETATPKRLRDAREEGNVAKSADAAAALILLASTIAIWIAIEPALGAFADAMRKGLDPMSFASSPRVDALEESSRPALLAGLSVAAPLMGISMVLTWLAHVWQVGILATTKALQPKPERLNPIAGFGRLLGPRGLVKAVLDLGKVAAVGVVVWMTVAGMAARIATLPGLDAVPAMLSCAGLLLELALKVGAVLLLLGIADFAWQKWRHARDLRMTKHEVKEEYRQHEGDPELKRRRLQIQRQIAMQRIGAAVPKADVIVTNPEHISVALAYDADSMRAPKVVAMGADHLALRIRQLAKQHGVPILERKPLARALYRQARVGQEIPPDLYKAVAEVLAYVYRISGTAAKRKERLARAS